MDSKRSTIEWNLGGGGNLTLSRRVCVTGVLNLPSCSGVENPKSIPCSGVLKPNVLYCIVLYCIALHCIALHCIALHCIVLYCIVLKLINCSDLTLYSLFIWLDLSILNIIHSGKIIMKSERNTDILTQTGIFDVWDQIVKKGLCSGVKR